MSNIEMDKIIKDAKASKLYLLKTDDFSSARGRRCVNILQNVSWLLKKNGDIVRASARIINWNPVLESLHNVEEF